MISGIKPISSNITMPTISFSRILCHCKFEAIGVNEYFLHRFRQFGVMIIYHPYPISSQYLKMWGVDSHALLICLIRKKRSQRLLQSSKIIQRCETLSVHNKLMKTSSSLWSTSLWLLPSIPNVAFNYCFMQIAKPFFSFRSQGIHFDL